MEGLFHLDLESTGGSINRYAHACQHTHISNKLEQKCGHDKWFGFEVVDNNVNALISWRLPQAKREISYDFTQYGYEKNIVDMAEVTKRSRVTNTLGVHHQIIFTLELDACDE